ncbi:MAG TPA: malto-oligosyltrehalose trehalohydrolase [Thermomicrobiales bacterium]|nr:malto-oligosyltrehalose trehalohydrolase [Thermomicrobiales bacterium]
MTESGTRGRMGAQVSERGVRFAVWAPEIQKVEVELGSGERARRVALTRSDDGVWSGEVAGIGAGARYAYRLDGDGPFPDPYSRFQPEGVHGQSEVIDPDTFPWTDHDWRGLGAENLAIYELHVGTFTQEGTFGALVGELDELKRLGITAIELMPVAQCPGSRNWGYDGVDLFAPSAAYGRPDDLRRLVDSAHRVGLGVILDVVYNHLGPEGNYLRSFSPAYFNADHQTAWGDGLNWDGEGCAFVRQFAIDNACSWISEYHIDGLRLDATHAILDDSPRHIVGELAAQARSVAAAAGRRIVVIAEEGAHEISRTRPYGEGGDDLDAIWADDFHHEMRVALTNAHENYYAHYEGTTVGIERAINQGLELLGTHSDATPIRPDDPASAFVFCIQNHDQVGNRPFGDRLHHEINRDRYAVASTLLLACPETPLLFMGQEFAASTPFLYFTDHPEELGKLVTAGRREEFAGFPAFHDERLRETIPDPQAESTFLASKLDLAERSLNGGIYELYRELLHLRQDDPVLRHNDRSHTRATALTAQIVAIHRWWGTDQRLMLANIGQAIELRVSDIDALRMVGSRPWSLLLSTSDGRFSGSGAHPATVGFGAGRSVHLPARTAAIWAIEG